MNNTDNFVAAGLIIMVLIGLVVGAFPEQQEFRGEAPVESRAHLVGKGFILGKDTFLLTGYRVGLGDSLPYDSIEIRDSLARVK